MWWNSMPDQNTSLLVLLRQCPRVQGGVALPQTSVKSIKLLRVCCTVRTCIINHVEAVVAALVACAWSFGCVLLCAVGGGLLSWNERVDEGVSKAQ